MGCGGCGAQDLVDVETPATTALVGIVSGASEAAVGRGSCQAGREGVAAVALITVLDAKVLGPAAQGGALGRRDVGLVPEDGAGEGSRGAVGDASDALPAGDLLDNGGRSGIHGQAPAAAADKVGLPSARHVAGSRIRRDQATADGISAVALHSILDTEHVTPRTESGALRRRHGGVVGLLGRQGACVGVDVAVGIRPAKDGGNRQDGSGAAVGGDTPTAAAYNRAIAGARHVAGRLVTGQQGGIEGCVGTPTFIGVLDAEPRPAASKAERATLGRRHIRGRVRSAGKCARRAVDVTGVVGPAVDLGNLGAELLKVPLVNRVGRRSAADFRGISSTNQAALLSLDRIQWRGGEDGGAMTLGALCRQLN